MRPEPDRDAGWRRHLPLALVLLATLALFLPLLLNAGPPIGLDLPAWTATGHLLKTQVLPDQGWFIGAILPTVSAGQQLGSTYSLNLMILWLFNLVFSPGLAAKLPCVLAALVLAHGFYRVALRYATAYAAALGALLAVLANAELMLQGMWYDLLAVGLALHFWCTVQAQDRVWSGRRWLLATVLLALTIYAHPMGVIMAVVLLFATLLLVLRGKSPARFRLAAWMSMILPCALLLGAPQIAGLLGAAQADIQILPVDWATGWSRLLEISGFRASDGRAELVLLALLAIGLFALAGRLRRLPDDFLLPLSLLALVVVFIMVQRPLMALAECCRVPFVGSLAYYADRFTHLWGVLVLLLFVVLLSPRAPVATVHGRSRGHGAAASDFAPVSTWVARRQRQGRLLVRLLVAALLPLTVYLAFDQLRSPMQLTLGTIRERGELLALWSWLRDHPLAAGDRVCLEPTFGGYRVSSDGGWPGATTRLTHVFDLTPMFVPQVDQVGGSMYVNRFNERYMGRSGSFLGVDPQTAARAQDLLALRIGLLRCRTLVAHSEQVRQLLQQLPSTRLLAQYGTLAVLAHDPPAQPGTAELPLTRVDSRSFRLGPSPSAQRMPVLPLAYAARWQANWNGAPVALDDFDGLLRLHAPTGLAQGSGWLRYRPAPGRILALALLLAGLLGTLLVALNFDRWYGASGRL